MWLLPLFPFLARAAGRVFYRLTLPAEGVPATGPALLVANHPNSLLDPVLVVAAARRPVRFLAKAPLFTDPKVGWLIRGAAAIPVYRRSDDPEQMEKNVDMFRAVYAALGEGAAVGIFPEGVSHSEPALAPLKTGAARIALGAVASTGGPFPIVPVGLIHREKDVFRSEAQALIGPPISWDDLATRGLDHPDAVRALTERIGAALRKVTVNLDAWADLPLVECALDIWDAEFGADPDAPSRVARLEVITQRLSAIRTEPSSRWRPLVTEAADYCRRLRRLRLSPRDLDTDVRAGAAVRWSARRAYLLALPTVASALAGWVIFWVPFHATDRIARLLRPDHDQLSTNKLLVGIAVYAAWLALLAAVAGTLSSWVIGAVTLLVAPAIGLSGLLLRERWRGAWGDVRRFFLLRSRAALIQALRERRRSLAAKFRALYDESTHTGTPA